MDKETKDLGQGRKQQPTVPGVPDPELEFRRLENQETQLESGNTTLRQELVDGYTQLVRMIDKKHPLHGKIIERLKTLRAQLRESSSGVETKAEFKPIDVTSTLEGAKILEIITSNEVERCIEWFNALPEKLKPRFDKRLQDIGTKPTEAVRITAFRALNFEMSRIARVIQQGLEQTDTSATMDNVMVEYGGYDSDATTFDLANIRSSKPKLPSKIDFDVPISRNGLPYVYEVKSFSRKKYGYDAAARNQLLKYQTAIKQGKVSGATVEVRGRIDGEFLDWVMGTAVDKKGFVPDIEVMYTIEFPSGKEHRFVLNKKKESGQGFKFQNEEDYTDDEQVLIRGIQHSLIDKSIRGLLADTHIDAQHSHRVFEEHFGQAAVTSPEGGTNSDVLYASLEELMALPSEPAERAAVVRELIENIQNPEQLEAIWISLLGPLPADVAVLPALKKTERLRKRLSPFEFTNNKIFDFCSAIVGYDITEQPHRALKDLWDFSMAEPARISSAKVFGLYEQLRTQAITEKIKASEQKTKINSENKASATSEHANPAYVERLIQEYQDFLAQNPKLAAMKRQYIIPPERIPEAAQRAMSIVEKIREYELARQADPNEEEKRKKRVALGYDGRPEGVALDIEHVAIDTLFSMNAEGLPRTDVESQLKAATLTFFTELPDGRLKVKWRTPAEFEAAAETDPQLKKTYDGLPKKYRDQVDIWIKSAAFVRSYEWPERFMQIENLPAFLAGQDRRYQEIHVFDPVSGKTELHTNTNEEAIQKTENLLAKENIERAKQYITGTRRADQHKKPIARVEKAISALEKQRDDASEKAQLTAKGVAAELGRRQAELNQLRKQLLQRAREPGIEVATVQAELQAVEGELGSLPEKRTQAFDQVRSISVEYLSQIQAKQRELESIYKQVVPKAEWARFAREITHRQDENLMKLIYAVTAEGEVIVQEEVLRAQVTGRAAHSELNKGRNTYGAGELAFENRNGQWVFTEINNGSGHYRPDANTTLQYAKRLIAQKGIDVSSAQIIDCILRGVPLREAHAF